MDDNDFGTGTRRRGFSVMNLLAGLLILASIGVIILLILVFVIEDNPVADLFAEDTPEPMPTRVARLELPTSPAATAPPTEPSGGARPEIEVPATNTPVPLGSTATPRPIGTLRPTLTPSVTPTFPPATPTRTPTPEPTETPTPGPSPTATNTRSAFPFTKDLVSPQYLQNYANNAGCNWLGIAGEVFDINGNPVPKGQYRVHIWDSGVDQRVNVGDSLAYGPSGFEQFVFNAPRVQDHNIQLETASGTEISQVYRVQTRASCNQNLLYFVFVQNH